jgi:hypothetical protein
VPTFYELLDVGATASADEIKRAFRREIAKYHPDKVQHLGREFQEIAAVKAAELTQAYKTLSDESLRADYDAQLAAAQPPATPETPVPDERNGAERTQDRPVRPVEDHGTRQRVSQRVGTSDVMRKAAVQRFRKALNDEFGPCEETPLAGFDVMCAPPKTGFLSRTLPPRLLARVVDTVDGAAVQQTWGMALRLRKDDQRDACVFIMGPTVASPGELGRAIKEQRSRPASSTAKLVVVPVNTRTWSAHVPTDAPPQVKAFLQKLGER